MDTSWTLGYRVQHGGAEPWQATRWGDTSHRSVAMVRAYTRRADAFRGSSDSRLL